MLIDAPIAPPTLVVQPDFHKASSMTVKDVRAALSIPCPAMGDQCCGACAKKGELYLLIPGNNKR